MSRRPSTPARLAVLLSGSGRTLVNILERIREGSLAATVPLVIASRECLGAQRARDLGVAEVRVIPGRIPAAALEDILRLHLIDWVVLAGYLKLLSIPASYSGRVVNIHPALLPDFGGPGMYGERVHRAVIDSGATRSGCTVHFCDDVYDRGPIILQKTCPVLPGDDAHTLADRVFGLECAAYPEALQLLISGAIPPTRSQGTTA